MKITKKWLEKKGAGSDGLHWFLNQSEVDLYQLIDQLIKEERKNWAVWLLIEAMNGQQQLQFAIACAEMVLPIFEGKYPQDNRPRLAIAAAKKVLVNNSKENRKAAFAAACAAAAAAFETVEMEAAACAAAAGHGAAKAHGAAKKAAFAASATEAASWATKKAAFAANWEQTIQTGINILKGK